MQTRASREVIKVFRAYDEVAGITIFDDLAVIASDQTSSSWIFTTIHSPNTHNHAVSGHRQFGFTDNGDGTFTIFTRGADVATGIMDAALGEEIFEGGDALWNNFIDNIIEFINLNGGSAGNKQVISNRYDID